MHRFLCIALCRAGHNICSYTAISIIQDSSGSDTDEFFSAMHKGKGKGKAKKKRKRTVTVTALLLDRFQNDTPKGASRKILEQEGRFKRLYITKYDTYDEVHLRVCGAYKITNYAFLECIKGGNKLAVSSNQKMNGQDLIVRRGCLYLCKDVDKVCTFVTDLVNIYRDCMYLFVKYITHYNM